MGKEPRIILAIVGSRSFRDYDRFKSIVLDHIRGLGGIVRIVSGGAVGTDMMARRFAQEMGIPITEYKPEWDKYGRSAGYIRNELIIKDADSVIALWDGESAGTRHSIELAAKHQKPIKVFDI